MAPLNPMDWKDAHKKLEDLRFWSATHPWKSGAASSHEHKDAQIKNLLDALKKWNEHFFMSREEYLLCLLLDAYDHGVGDWIEKKPVLAKDCDNLRDLLGKYFFVVQASNGKVPSVLKFIFRKLEWPHGILTFELGEKFSIKHKKADSRIDEWIVTLPEIEDEETYINIIGHSKLTPINYETHVNIRETPTYNKLEVEIPKTSSVIWGSKYNNVIDFVSELCSACSYNKEIEPKDREEGAWILANISWFLKTASGGKHRYHYYFYRALPKPTKTADTSETEALFHTSGQGILGWASPIESDSDGVGRQAVALTACIIFSRIADAALPFYERRAVFHGAQRVLIQRSQLMWVIDHLLLPVMVGATISRDFTQHEEFPPLVYAFPADSPVSIPSPPPDIATFAKTLWPTDPYSMACDESGQQLKLLCELVNPLRADSRPQSAIDSLQGMFHDLRKLPKNTTQESIKESERLLKTAQNQLVSGGALFVPAFKEFQKIIDAFERFRTAPSGSSAVTESQKNLGLAVDKFVRVTESLGQLGSLSPAAEDWKTLPLSVEFCGHKTATGPFPKKPLPFHLSELDLAIRALHDNWASRTKNQSPGPLLRLVATEKHLFVVWSITPSWCNSEIEWRKKISESLKRPFASARGYPYVLRFAAQNAASDIWVSIGAVTFSVMGDLVIAGEAVPCVICAPSGRQTNTYEFGMAFPFAEAPQDI